MAQPAYVVHSDFSVPNKMIPTGFVFGAASVERICTLPRGAVAIGVETEKHFVTIVVSKTGKVRVTDKVKLKGPTTRKRPK